MFKQNNLLKICLGRRMKNGKAEASERWFYQVLLFLKRKRITKPAFFVYKVLARLRPPLGFKNKKIAGAKVKIPATLPIRQQYLKSLTWIFEGAKKRGRGFVSPQNFANELYAAAKFKNSYSFKLRRLFLRALLDSRAFLKHVR